MLRAAFTPCMRRCAVALRQSSLAGAARFSSEGSAASGVQSSGVGGSRFSSECGGPSLRPQLMHVGLPDPAGLPFNEALSSLEKKIAAELARLADYLMAADWGDSFALTTDSAFWDADLERLERQAAAFEHSESVRLCCTALVTLVQTQLKETRRLFDCLRRAEDARDHLNELLEIYSRSSGIGGVGIRASPSLSNVEAHAKAVSDVYVKLLEEFPDFSSKIEESVGYGLALLRQKAKFDFPSQHEYFF